MLGFLFLIENEEKSHAIKYVDINRLKNKTINNK
jgi:hypothetical protein